MKDKTRQFGFSAVELLITLFIAAAFLISGYQLYSVVIKDGGEARRQAVASNTASDYLERYKASATNPCTESTPLADSVITPAISGIPNATVSVAINCPYDDVATTPITSVSKVTITIKYGNPQQTVRNATYVTP